MQAWCESTLNFASAQDIRFHHDQSTTNSAFGKDFSYTHGDRLKELQLKNSHPHQESLERIVRKLPLRQQVAALGDAILVAPIHERDAHAWRLIEIAGLATKDKANAHASSPLELLTGVGGRWRARFADEALLALARGWLQLSDPVRKVAVSLGRQRWIDVVQRLKDDPTPGARLAAVAVAEDTADPAFGPVVCEMLCDEQQSVRVAADRALLRLCVTMLEHLPRAMLGDELAELAARPKVTLHADPKVIELERCTLFESIADAAWSFSSHRCRSALLAALLLMDRAAQTPMEHAASNKMRRLLAQNQHPSHSPMRTVLRRSAVPILRERALRWVVIGPLTQAASDRLLIAETLEEHQVVLEHATLGARPKRGERLGAIRHNSRVIGGKPTVEENGFLPTPRVFAMLDERSRVGLLRLMHYAGTDEPTRRLYIDAALGDESPCVRRHAAQLADGADLVDFLYDQNDSIARGVAVRWSSVGLQPVEFAKPAWAHRDKITRVNLRSANSWVRRVAREEAERISPWQLESPASRLHARRMHAKDPGGFVRLIRDRLTDPDTCCDGLMLVRALGLHKRFELDLIGIVQDETADAKTLATAVCALGQVDTDSARRMIRQSLTHKDDRVRANAVEAIDESPAVILELKDDPSHRVRANAIRRVISLGSSKDPNNARDAGDGLVSMLDDKRIEHRLAGAWAAQRTVVTAARGVLGTTWNPLVERITHLAVDDKDEQVRDRASRCANRLLVEIEAENAERVR